MAEKDSQSNSQEQQPEQQFSQEQYDILKRCSDEKDMTEWDEWREKNRSEKILLEGADLRGANLKGVHLEDAILTKVHLENAILCNAHLQRTNLSEAYLDDANLQDAILANANLQGANLERAHLENANLSEVHLEGALLAEAHLENANFSEAHLEGAVFWGAYLQGANLWKAHVEGANLCKVHLESAVLLGAHLEGARLEAAHLEGAYLRNAHLEDVKFLEAHLERAGLIDANLKGADFSRAIVDGGTLVWACDVDRDTKFEAVGLDSMRIYPATKQLLEYNIRRMNWEVWYEYKDWDKIKPEDKRKRLSRILLQPVQWFWAISDYGRSTWRIILTFFALAIIFATAYFTCGAVDYYLLGIKDQPGIVNDLFVPVTTEQTMSDVYYGVIIYLRSVYFSVVTMTTLGFGDMYANTTCFGLQWWIGHLLLIIQVILGYVLLGALVTRFAVLFTAGGPAGEFTEKEQKSEQRQ